MTTHYFNQESQSSQEYFSVSGKISGEYLNLSSAKGLFSAKSFDTGTSFLLGQLKVFFSTMECKKDYHILDLGCGYGLVSAWLLQHLGHHSYLRLSAIDSSPLAVDLTKHNIKNILSDISSRLNVPVWCSDSFSHSKISQKTFDCIISNPPFSAGKKVVQEFIRESYDHLVEGGSLWMVAPTKKGAKTYIAYTAEVFGESNIEVLVIKKGYRVRRAKKIITK